MHFSSSLVSSNSDCLAFYLPSFNIQKTQRFLGNQETALGLAVPTSPEDSESTSFTLKEVPALTCHAVFPPLFLSCL